MKINYTLKTAGHSLNKNDITMICVCSPLSYKLTVERKRWKLDHVNESGHGPPLFHETA